MALTVWNDVTVSGQYAGLVAASWKGQTYIRSAPSKANNNSPKQKNHKELYRFAYSLFSPAYEKGIKPFFNPPKMTASNAIIKAQSKEFWSFDIINTQAYTRVFERFRFPLSDVNINVNTPYSLFGGQEGHYEFTNFEVTGKDADKIIQWNIISYQQRTKEIIYSYGSIENPPTVIYPMSYWISSFLYFCTENNISQLYMLGRGNALPTQ